MTGKRRTWWWASRQGPRWVSSAPPPAAAEQGVNLAVDDVVGDRVSRPGHLGHSLRRRRDDAVSAKFMSPPGWKLMVTWPQARTPDQICWHGHVKQDVGEANTARQQRTTESRHRHTLRMYSAVSSLIPAKGPV
jgi:hypothetical protein